MNDNRLIAEFMGVNPTILGDEITYEMYGIIDCIKDGLDEQHFFLEEELMFHTSWDWLMPVVVKCFAIHDDEEFMYDKWTEKADNLNYILNNALLEINIQSLYQAVVEFIKEVNELTK